MRSIKASEIAALCQGRLAGPDLDIKGLSGLKEARPGFLSFLSNPKYASSLSGTQASCIIVTPGTEVKDKTLIECHDPYLGFAKAAQLFYRESNPKPKPGIHPAAVVSPSARIDPTASIGPYAVIEAGTEIGPRTVVMGPSFIGARVKIGSDGLIYPNASVREECILGNGVIIHCGAVVGSDGFGYAREGAKYVKIPQTGIVILEDEVEIGANSTIDRGALGPTRIKRGTKLDNLVHIAHNVEIGEDGAIAALSGIAGSTIIGDRLIMGGQVGVIGHLEIGDDVICLAQSGVTKSAPSKTMLYGNPARPHMKVKRIAAAVDMLPEKLKAIKELEQRVAELEEKIKG
ncbi:UDP-3-O-(3-hydroxymyristoyl)glucosamine N-acyltransferase [candidate division TA06 bacterium]|uniref:UDP-3-O-acylglucosamine N-acyltransferase n=1 Tax=candidate division TA06 bacterium TaxID=2250710 RepID=A0A933I7M9_UNCT6|nr:UDP-3-O-(3-hydroxymyristoyl)glucosamine N-acyltransferase [candidate division TA06 bacterium]